MYGVGFLAVALLPLLVSAAPTPTDYELAYCCTITSKTDFPDINPNDYFKVPCTQYQGDFYDTEQDIVNNVWRAECHNVYSPPPGLHAQPLTVINVDCKEGADACE